MADSSQIGALVVVAAVFLYGLKKDWDGVYLLFGIILMLGSCKMLGVQ